MKKIFKRFIAYLIDMMVVILITQSLSGIPIFNNQLDDYEKYYKDYIELYENYATFKQDLTSKFEDEQLSLEEYNALIEEHEAYNNTLEEYYINDELTKDNFDELNKIIDEEYNKAYNRAYYNLEKNNIAYLIIYLLASIAYFVLFNKYTNGQTLGKKLMRLKIVNSKDENKNVPIISYIIRLIILYQPIYYIIRLIGINLMNATTYSNVTTTVYQMQGYLEMLIIAMMMIRTDGRGPQDLLAKTRVALYDRNGFEIKDKPDMLSQKMQELQNSNKKVIDEEQIDNEENTSKELVVKEENKGTNNKETKKKKTKKEPNN